MLPASSTPATAPATTPANAPVSQQDLLQYPFELSSSLPSGSVHASSNVPPQYNSQQLPPLFCRANISLMSYCSPLSNDRAVGLLHQLAALINQLSFSSSVLDTPIHGTIIYCSSLSSVPDENVPDGIIWIDPERANASPVACSDLCDSLVVFERNEGVVPGSSCISLLRRRYQFCIRNQLVPFFLAHYLAVDSSISSKPLPPLILQSQNFLNQLYRINYCRGATNTPSSSSENTAPILSSSSFPSNQGHLHHGTLPGNTASSPPYPNRVFATSASNINGPQYVYTGIGVRPRRIPFLNQAVSANNTLPTAVTQPVAMSPLRDQSNFHPGVIPSALHPFLPPSNLVSAPGYPNQMMLVRSPINKINNNNIYVNNNNNMMHPPASNVGGGNLHYSISPSNRGNPPVGLNGPISPQSANSISRKRLQVPVNTTPKQQNIRNMHVANAQLYAQSQHFHDLHANMANQIKTSSHVTEPYVLADDLAHSNSSHRDVAVSRFSRNMSLMESILSPAPINYTSKSNSKSKTKGESNKNSNNLNSSIVANTVQVAPSSPTSVEGFKVDPNPNLNINDDDGNDHDDDGLFNSNNSNNETKPNLSTFSADELISEPDDTVDIINSEISRLTSEIHDLESTLYHNHNYHHLNQKTRLQQQQQQQQQKHVLSPFVHGKDINNIVATDPLMQATLDLDSARTSEQIAERVADFNSRLGNVIGIIQKYHPIFIHVKQEFDFKEDPDITNSNFYSSNPCDTIAVSLNNSEAQLSYENISENQFGDNGVPPNELISQNEEKIIIFDTNEIQQQENKQEVEDEQQTGREVEELTAVATI